VTATPTRVPVAVTGTVQHYAWGDPDFIPSLLGVEPDGQPWAELWLGTHPNGPTTTVDGTPLGELTGHLPYLVKVLAAAEPLSLQLHPDTRQALDGFARGVYPDDQPKPELLCALTAFDALCGIRPVDATLALLDRIGAEELAAAVRSDGIGPTIQALYRRRLPTDSTLAACNDAAGIEAALVRDLATRYPGEPSVAVTLLLNRVHLEPGEALHLTAGNLHAYLHGAGIELMGPSDNVVRGGLTVKPVDVDELLRILDPTPLAEPVMSGAALDGVYPLPEAGCTLRRLDAGVAHTSTGHELAIGMDGTTSYLPPGTELTTTVTTYVVTTP
jgi:mannose-6-phosphate isomerase